MTVTIEGGLGGVRSTSREAPDKAGPATDGRHGGAGRREAGPPIRAVDLGALATEASGCTRCRLAQGRTTVVFGDGRGDEPIMFVGEAPGYHEDQQGVPFVGAAGKLLGTLLAEVGLSRDQAYIANVLLCRPPGNRDPQPDEIDSCSPYLRRRLELVQPRIVVTLGNFASRLLLGRTTGISRLRGQVYPFRGARLIPTYHPAALLRGGRPEMMAEARADFRLIADTLTEVLGEEAGQPAEQLGLF